MAVDFSLSGGAALVTGAGSGIGRAIALGLAEAGAPVGCVDQVLGNVKAAAAEILATGVQAIPIVADVTDPAALSAAVARHVIDVDLTGVFLSCQAEAQAMIRNGGGSIVNIASMSATIANRGLHQAHYNSAKAGRNAQPQDMVGPVIFLLSGAAAFVTGVDLLVDGGHVIW